MFPKVHSLGGMLLLAGAAVFMTTDAAQAQRGGHGGGGHGGGGHGGGGHAGGFHAGGNHGGGFQAGGNHGGGFHHGEFHHGGHGRSGGYWPYYGHRHYFPGYYPYYGYYPYSSLHNYYPYLSVGSDADESVYTDDTPLLNDRPTYDSGYRGLSAEEYEAYARAATVNRPSPPAPVDTLAHVTVRVPAEAEIWIEGTKMASTGPIREFVSPPLTSGSRYTYDIKASWNENGRAVTQTQHVGVSAGAHVKVDFPVPPKSAAQAPAVPQN